MNVSKYVRKKESLGIACRIMSDVERKTLLKLKIMWDKV